MKVEIASMLNNENRNCNVGSAIKVEIASLLTYEKGICK